MSAFNSIDKRGVGLPHFFYHSYCILLCMIVGLGSIFVLFLSFKKKYSRSIPARFLMVNNTLPHFRDLPIVWFHACSFGEIKSLEPIVKHFQQDYEILITTVTNTGYENAIRLYPQSHIRFIPCDFLIGYWLRNMPPRLQYLITVEAEIWLGLFYNAKKRGARTFLLSARLSDRSFPKYQKFAFFYRKIFLCIDKILCQSNLDVERFIQIGSNPKTTLLLGNIKILSVPSVTHIYPKPKKPLFIAASTHRGEEALILEAFLEAFKDCREVPMLAFVPRHPERFDEVRVELEKCLIGSQKKLVVGSVVGLECALEHNDGFILVDCLGELINLYAIATLVILGGSFVENVGGHNPLEPAFFGVKLLSGPFVFNQISLFNVVENALICKSNELASYLRTYTHIPQSRFTKSIHLQEVLEEIS